jgi:hypothetical protein
MTPFQRGTLPESAYNYHTYMAPPMSMSKAEAKAFARARQNDAVWVNDIYQVFITTYDNGSLRHLSIKRHDRAPIHDWRDLQHIKNELVGAECEAVELYPAESRRVDEANQFHLYAFPSGYRVPFGFQCRNVLDDGEGPALPNAKQRPLEAWDHAKRGAS